MGQLLVDSSKHCVELLFFSSERREIIGKGCPVMETFICRSHDGFRPFVVLYSPAAVTQSQKCR